MLSARTPYGVWLSKLALLIRSHPRLITGGFYLTVTLLVIGPWLQPGFVLTLDMVFGPIEPTPDDEFFGFDAPVLGAKYIPEALHRAMSAVISEDWSQKVLLATIFLVAGIGAHVLAPVRWTPAKLISGTLYAVNPFVYARLLAGQWFVLAGYAFLPLAAWATLRALESKSPRRWLTAALLISATAFNAQTFVFGVLLVGAIAIGWVIRNRDMSVLPRLSALGVAVLALNLYWIAPALQSSGTVLQQIDDRDLLAFAPTAQFSTVLVSFTGLYGFWRDGYEYPVTRSAAFYFLLVPIVWLALTGAIARWREPVVGASIVLAAIAIVLGPGINGPFSGIFRFLFENVPFFDGFRDSHKFAALLALAYALLAAVGFDHALQLARERTRLRIPVRSAALLLLLLVIASYTYTAWFGFGGRLKVTQYPDDWAQARALLDAEVVESSVLLLPWDTYAEYPWSPNREKTVRTLTKAYLSQDLVFPKHVIKRAGIFSQSNSPEQGLMRDLLNDAPFRTDFGEQLGQLAISHIVVAKAGSWEQYEYLPGQVDLTLAFDGPNIQVYRNDIAVQRLEAAQTEDSFNLAIEKESPVHYSYSNESGVERVRFTAPNGDIDGWRVDGKEPLSSDTGTSGVFAAADSGTIEYYPARGTRTWILVSLVVLVVLLLGSELPARLSRRFQTSTEITELPR